MRADMVGQLADPPGVALVAFPLGFFVRSSVDMQFFRFLLVGLINTFVGLGLIYFCMSVLGLDYRVANFAGYAVGSGVSFVLNRNWTFRAEGSWLDGLLRWSCVVGGAYVLNFITLVLVHDRLGIRADVSQLAGMVVYTLSSFVGGRCFAFRNKKEQLVEITAL